MASWTIRGGKVEAEIQALGAMLGPARFDVCGRPVQPFAIAPWPDDVGPAHDALPGILKRLRGEWPCVPFGMPTPPSDLPDAWAVADPHRPADPHPHGISANVEWALDALSADAVALSLDYPADHPVRRVSRTIRADSLDATRHLTLRVEARTRCELPIGLHPTFAMPGAAREMRVGFAGDARCWTMPCAPEPGVSVLAHGRRDVPLAAVPLLNGGREDLTALPLPYDTEEIVLVTNPGGIARLDVEGRVPHSVVIEWDDRLLPTCQLWISNRGRKAYPWRGRFLALGVEPLAAAFDLGVGPSLRPDNPLRLAGIATARVLDPEHPFECGYRISIEPRAGGAGGE